MIEPEEPTIQRLFDLRGRVALVTGASGYLGSAMARALAECGARVVVGSRDVTRAAEVLASLPAVEGGEHFAVTLDQMDERSLDKGFCEAIERADRMDILVNNGHEILAADWRAVTAEQFTRQLANATGYFLLARELHSQAIARGGPGSVIMVGSMYGVVASYPEVYEGLPNASPAAYHALKGSIVHLTRHLAAYWAKDGVRVNCLSPGPFPSEKADPKLVARLNKKVPMGRIGKPSELKGAVAFLASDASSYVTGQNLLVDGGWTAW